jgi:hypothetical protein
MADLAGATAATLPSLPEELPVEAAVACGNCRLFADAAPQIVFPAWLATAAAHRLVPLLAEATRDAERLPDLLDDCTGDEAEDLVAGLVHARMDSWAALLQLDDVLEHASDDAERADLEAAIGAFDEALERFDRALSEREDCLSMLADTRLLANFRTMLAPKYCDPMPWWLDGRLEAAVDAVDAATDRLVAATLFDKPAIRPVDSVLTFGRLRAATSQTYAAAASTAALPRTAAGPWLRWRSPDGVFTAELVPPVELKVVPQRLVIDFTEADGRPALDLTGRACLLAGVASSIEQRKVDGIERAVASFAGDAVFGWSSGDDRPVALVVGADAPWPFVAK